MRPLLLLLAASFVLWPEVSLAQQNERTPPRRFDAEFGYLSFSWVARPFGSFAIGPEFGGGFLQQKVITPSGDDLTGLVHLGVTSTLRLNEYVDVEVGIRAGAGELKSVACAGCSFSGYAGAALAMFAGSRTVRFGTRFVRGRIEGTSMFTWSPLVLRLQF